MNAFRERLRDIRTTEARRARLRQRLTDEELGLNDRSEQFHELRDSLVEKVETLMQDFCREALGFSVHFGFYEGKYSVTLSAEEYLATPSGVTKEFSRATFLLSPLSEQDMGFECMAKATVRNRDLPSSTCRGRLGQADDRVRVDSFIEDRMLRFARAYFSQGVPLGVN